jgi:hypothetical protein
MLESPAFPELRPACGVLIYEAMDSDCLPICLWSRHRCTRPHAPHSIDTHGQIIAGKYHN